MKKIAIPKKPVYLKLAVDIDFYDLFQKIEQEFDTCFLLESLGSQGSMSRYSIIGFDPKSVLKGNGNMLEMDGRKYQTKNPYFTLRDIIPQDIISRNYAGGLIGYLGYDCINFFEKSLSVKKHPLFDQFLMGLYLDGIILDKVTGEAYYFYFNVNRINLIYKLINNKLKKKFVQIKKDRDSFTKDQHRHFLGKIKEEILVGNTFQCQLCLQKEFEIHGDPILIYSKLRKINPSPFMYYIKFGFSTETGSKAIIGASPELLFGMRQKEMTSFPLAGTIKRGKTEREDTLLAKKLLSDQKELAEHKMLVDLHRNDMGKVGIFGSVKVRNYMEIKRFSHVSHISSEIVGLLAPNEDMFSALASNFPAGTLTGAPKIESIKIIDKIEKKPRGPYGGAVGHFGFNGDATFAIPIRTIFISGNYGFIAAASGIVVDSVAENEYDEVQRKLKPLEEVLGI